MGIRELRKALRDIDKKEIIQLVVDMYKGVPDAKNYLDIFVTGDVDTLIEKYKYEIERYVYPFGRDLVLREREARKLIRKVRKMNITELNIELELYYVSCCIDVIADFGYCDEDYYISIENMFASAVKGIQSLGLLEKYRKELMRLSRLGQEYGMELEY